METIDFNQVIKDNISVVGELIGPVTKGENGLYPYYMFNNSGVVINQEGEKWIKIYSGEQNGYFITFVEVLIFRRYVDSIIGLKKIAFKNGEGSPIVVEGNSENMIGYVVSNGVFELYVRSSATYMEYIVYEIKSSFANALKGSEAYDSEPTGIVYC